jgi:uncharacterized RDD family membrane protein YckC
MDEATTAGAFGIVRTPTATYTPAAWGARVRATVLDSVIAYGGLFVGLALGGVVSDIVLVATLIAALVVLLLYAPLMLAYGGGQTLGKRAVGIRVELGDGRPIGLGMAFARELLVKGLLFGIIPLIGWIDVLWPLWERDNRALHDLACGTHVVDV